MRSALLLIPLLFPAALTAQEICSPDFLPATGTVPSCWSGAWYGRSDALDRFAVIMEMLPPNVQAQMTGAMGSDLMIAIYPDGGYVTFPMSAQLDGIFIGEEAADDTDFTMDLVVTPATGQMWEPLPGRLAFCTDPGMGMGLLSTTATNGMGTRMGGANSAVAPGGFEPEIDISCAGTRMEMFVHLPDPIGTVTYLLNRIPEHRMPPEFRSAFDGRFE